MDNAGIGRRGPKYPAIPGAAVSRGWWACNDILGNRRARTSVSEQTHARDTLIL